MAERTYKIGLSNADKTAMQTDIENKIAQGTVVVHNATKATQDQNGDVIDETYAKQDGYYQTLGAGIADNVKLTASVNDMQPANFIITGDSATADVATGTTASLEKVQGVSVVLNQLVQNGNFASNTGWSGVFGTIAVASNVCTYTITEVGDFRQNRVERTAEIPLVSGHKYLVSCYVKPSKNCEVYAYAYGPSGNFATSTSLGTALANTKTIVSNVIDATNTTSTSDLRISFGITEKAIGDTVEISNVQLIDLTLMFGNNSRIPDGLNGTNVLEYATDGDLDRVVSPAGIFSRLFPLPFYAYNLGTIQNVNFGGNVVSVGRNAFDGELESGGISTSTGGTYADATRVRSKNYIKVVPEQVYLLNQTCSNTFTVRYFHEYDENKNYIKRTVAGGGSPSTVGVLLSNNTHYVKIEFSGSNNLSVSDFTNVYIQLRHSGNYVSYKAYETHTKTIPTFTGKGIFGGTGDTYESNGKKTVRYGMVDLGTLDWAYDLSYSVFHTAGVPIKPATTYDERKSGFLCSRYKASDDIAVSTLNDKSMIRYVNSYIYIKDSSYTDAATFKTAMSGVYLVYELATETETSEEAFGPAFWVDDMGTVDFGSLIGQKTIYLPNADDMITNTKTRVDDLETRVNALFTNISGYDATKEQHLEQHNGTLIWVDNE